MPTKVFLSSEEVKSLALELIEGIIGKEEYKHSSVCLWSDQITERLLQQLVEASSLARYMVNATIVQKNGAGVNTSTRCFWDNERDRLYTIRWENQFLHCFVNVFALPLLQ